MTTKQRKGLTEVGNIIQPVRRGLWVERQKERKTTKSKRSVVESLKDAHTDCDDCDDCATAGEGCEAVRSGPLSTATSIDPFCADRSRPRLCLVPSIIRLCLCCLCPYELGMLFYHDLPLLLLLLLAHISRNNRHYLLSYLPSFGWSLSQFYASASFRPSSKYRISSTWVFSGSGAPTLPTRHHTHTHTRPLVVTIGAMARLPPSPHTHHSAVLKSSRSLSNLHVAIITATLQPVSHNRLCERDDLLGTSIMTM